MLQDCAKVLLEKELGSVQGLPVTAVAARLAHRQAQHMEKKKTQLGSDRVTQCRTYRSAGTCIKGVSHSDHPQQDRRIKDGDRKAGRRQRVGRVGEEAEAFGTVASVRL